MQIHQKSRRISSDVIRNSLSLILKSLIFALVCVSVYLLFLEFRYFYLPVTNISAENLSQNPTSPPAFVASVTKNITQTHSELCATINLFVVAQLDANRTIDKNYINYIMSDTRLALDDRIIPYWELKVSRVDSARINDVDTPNGVITWCASTKIDTGLHKATIIMPQLAGKEYSYSWAFEVESN